jgi:hypothetical protein
MDCAEILADLPVDHALFVRGNHEDAKWTIERAYVLME